MPAPAQQTPARINVWAYAAASLALAAAVRGAMILAFPTVHGGDSVARLANASTFVLAYQLPLPQAFVVVGKAISDDPLLARFFFCIWGGVLAAGVTALVGRVWGGAAAAVATILLASDPLLIHYSIVPYQEPVAYGLVAWAFYLAPGRHERAAAWLMAAACLSRYEAWLFLPGFFVATGRKRSSLLFASVPVLAWVSWWGGLGPRGTYVVDIDLLAARVSRVAYLAGKWIEYETVWLIVPALLGCLLALRNHRSTFIRVALQLAFVMAAVVTFGHEYPPGSGLVSERLIHLPVIAVIMAASVSLGWMGSRSRPLAAAAVTLTLLLGARHIRFETWLLRATAEQPDLALARLVAHALDGERAASECVSVLAPGIDPAILDAYVAKVGAAFGDAARARELTNALGAASPDRDRIAAQLKAPVGTVRAGIGCPLLVAIDAAGGNAVKLNLAGARLLGELQAGSRYAAIYRIRR